ncbi:MAG TPA: peroxiredoxin [Candidatus Binataceae bacterium]|nr:peroxiredoxin [Candidatus Binataceae bacterium]
MLKPGDKAPPFALPSTTNGSIGRVSLDALRTELVVMFFYPRDFSFICPTEVIGFHHHREDFAGAGASIVGISVDSVESHVQWAKELGGVNYPLAADAKGEVARLYGVFEDKEQVAMRATFILDRRRTIAYAVASQINVGRSVSETLRVVRALRSGQLCPADWQPGDGVGPDGLKY